MLDNLKLKVSSPEDQIGYWLRYVSNNISYSFSMKLESGGVTVAEWIILRQMFEVGKTSPGVVAAKIGLTKGAISKLISRLLEKGLVERNGLVADRRFQEIKLTVKGRRLVPQLALIADKNDKFFFGNLSKSEKYYLINFLKNMVRTHRFGRKLAIVNGKD